MLKIMLSNQSQTFHAAERFAEQGCEKRSVFAEAQVWRQVYRQKNLFANTSFCLETCSTFPVCASTAPPADKTPQM